MKIAFVTYEYPPFIMGGAGIYAKHITEKLAELGIEVTVFTPNINETENKDFENLKIIPLNVNNKIPFKALQFWLALPKVLKKVHLKNKFDLVHFNGLSYWFYHKKILNIPQVLTVHHIIKDITKHNNLTLSSSVFDISGENSFLIRLIEKRAINSIDKIITDSKFTKKEIIKFYKLNPKDINVIYLGIEERNKNCSINTKNFLRETGLPNKKMLLFVGRINDPRKGLEPLIMAFKQLLNETDAILVVVGNGDKTKFEELSKKLNISQYIFFIGFVDDNKLNKFYQSCDVYICPSKLEGFGLTVLEAINNGAPVIAFKVGAIPEIVKDGKNGLLIDPYNLKQLSHAICHILKDNNLRNKIKRNNEFYETRNWIKTAKETQNLYISLIGVKEIE